MSQRVGSQHILHENSLISSVLGPCRADFNRQETQPLGDTFCSHLKHVAFCGKMKLDTTIYKLHSFPVSCKDPLVSSGPGGLPGLPGRGLRGGQGLQAPPLGGAFRGLVPGGGDAGHLGRLGRLGGRRSEVGRARREFGNVRYGGFWGVQFGSAGGRDPYVYVIHSLSCIPPPLRTPWGEAP